MPDDEWDSVVDLIERVVGEDDLLPAVVTGVRTMVREVAVLPQADIAAHTRALLAAATRALAARRGPTEAELSFVEELGVTRARQGVPIEAVLAAIHVAERAIWSRAREAAAAERVDAELLLDARELYGDWAEAVRTRLIKAHRATDEGRRAGAAAGEAATLRRLLEGGSAATLAAAGAGLPVDAGLWILVARPGDAGLEQALRDPRRHGPAVVGHVDGLLVAVLSRAPGAASASSATAAASLPGPETAAGLAGPAEPEELAAARRLAAAALTAAEATGRRGVVHVGDVAALAALADRADLSSVLLDRHRPAWAALGPGARPVALAVLAWLEAGRETAPAAERLFVHPNTIRNRVQRFADVTGVDPFDTFGAVNAWWLCRTWLAADEVPDVRPTGL